MLAPVGSLIVGAHVAVPAIILSMFVTTAQLFAPTWRHVRWSDQLALSLSGCIGVPAGVALLVFLDPELMRRGISVLTVLLALFLMTGWRSGHPPTRLGAASVGGLGGVLSGSTSLGGPPVATTCCRPGSAAQTRQPDLLFAFNQLVSLDQRWIGGLMNWEVLSPTRSSRRPWSRGPGRHELFHLASERIFRLAALTIMLLVGVSTLLAK